MIRALALALGAAGLLALGCAPPPQRFGSKGVITRPAQAFNSPEEAFGRQISVFAGQREFYGELVACDDAFVYLHLNDTASPWVMVPWPSVGKAEVRTASNGLPSAITWTVIGALAGISHGYWFIISGPVWAAVGIPSAFWAAANDRMQGKCQELRPYARYPQGMPELIRPRYWGPVGPQGPPLSVPPAVPAPPPEPTGPLPAPSPVAPPAAAPLSPAPPSGPPPAAPIRPSPP